MLFPLKLKEKKAKHSVPFWTSLRSWRHALSALEWGSFSVLNWAVHGALQCLKKRNQRKIPQPVLSASRLPHYESPLHLSAIRIWRVTMGKRVLSVLSRGDCLEHGVHFSWGDPLLINDPFPQEFSAVELLKICPKCCLNVYIKR